MGVGLPDGRYAAPSGALSYNENVAVVRVTPGNAPGDAGADRDPAARTFARRRQPGPHRRARISGRACDLTRLPGSAHLTIRGSVPAGGAVVSRNDDGGQPDAVLRRRPPPRARGARHRGARRRLGHRRPRGPAAPDAAPDRRPPRVVPLSFLAGRLPEGQPEFLRRDVPEGDRPRARSSGIRRRRPAGRARDARRLGRRRRRVRDERRIRALALRLRDGGRHRHDSQARVEQTRGCAVRSSRRCRSARTTARSSRA